MTEIYDWQIPGARIEIYDAGFIPAMIAEWSSRLAELAGLRQGERVPDVACGTGDWARCAAPRMPCSSPTPPSMWPAAS